MENTYYKVAMGGKSCIYDTPEEVFEEVKELLLNGDSVQITPIQLTEEEIKALPDFQGW
jgi:hypothetical protein